jgi:type I restriction-modification system DNA methylase subunit
MSRTSNETNQVLGTLRNVERSEARADHVLANPTANYSSWSRKNDDPAKRECQSGVPPKGKANFACAQYYIHHFPRRTDQSRVTGWPMVPQSQIL